MLNLTHTFRTTGLYRRLECDYTTAVLNVFDLDKRLNLIMNETEAFDTDQENHIISDISWHITLY